MLNCFLVCIMNLHVELILFVARNKGFSQGGEGLGAPSAFHLSRRFKDLNNV